MDFQKIYDSILEEYLPSRWSIWIAGLTPTLAFAAIFLPEFLQKIGTPPTEIYILPLRIGLPLLISFVGTFTVLLIVVSHYKTLKATRSNDGNTSVGNLSEKTLKFLKCIANLKQKKIDEPTDAIVAKYSKNINAETLSILFNCSVQEAQFHIDQLESAYCLEHDQYHKVCDISPKGRKLLHVKNMLP